MNKLKFQTFSSKSARGCLQEVLAYNSDSNGKLLVSWKTGRRGKVITYERGPQQESKKLKKK